MIGALPKVGHTQPSCHVDTDGNRLPNQWCSGDVFLGLGETKYVQQLDEGGEPILDEYGDPVWSYVVQNGGQFKVVDSRGVPQQNDVVVDSGRALTPACTVDAETGDLWTAGGWSNRISHMRARAAGSRHELSGVRRRAYRRLASIDVTRYTLTKGCSDYGYVRPGCGAARSLVFDRSGNLYVGTDDGTNKILKFRKSGKLLDSYTVPGGLRGPGWIDLAADQTTVFYTTRDNTIRIFRTDRQPLPQSLFNAGVEHLTDAVLDPRNLGLFGKIVVKNAADDPIQTETYRVRVLPPGDGSGGLLVVYDATLARIDLSGHHVQGYPAVGVYPLYSFDLTPDGKSVWMMTKANATWTSPAQIVKSHLPTGVTEVDSLTGPGWTAVRGLCVNRAYTAAVSQPDCTADPTDSLCQPLPNCTAGDQGSDCIPPGTPVIEQPADRANDEGDTITALQIVASDPYDRPLTYGVDFLPRGLTFDATTRTISGTVGWLAADALGAPWADVRITVTNDRGLLARKWFRWFINNVDAPPAATASSSFPSDH